MSKKLSSVEKAKLPNLFDEVNFHSIGKNINQIQKNINSIEKQISDIESYLMNDFTLSASEKRESELQIEEHEQRKIVLYFEIKDLKQQQKDIWDKYKKEPVKRPQNVR